MTSHVAATERLREAGLRLTPQRTIIFDILSSVRGHGHVTAQELLDQARDRLPGLNAATVYRTLETLHEAGLVDRMLSQAGSDVRFAVRDPRHRHCHLLCTSCGTVHELALEVIERLGRSIQRDTGFQINVDHVTLDGLCGKCQDK